MSCACRISNRFFNAIHKDSDFAVWLTGAANLRRHRVDISALMHSRYIPYQFSNLGIDSEINGGRTQFAIIARVDDTHLDDIMAIFHFR
ncbi:Uncharacterised protein [Salmonella enterica subsp. enterica serovar Bovismorbificans]|uniref:Uncharacterized protein n=1 Tax=Salmonella enterica subsp. enterica serovar Bovismorbificans TaxID=58097 RepID=A0A655CUS1_SALET|nr:Uncharacterised protein [Salmonella enterica subsp. enterica serovar Bovismorbificans]